MQYYSTKKTFVGVAQDVGRGDASEFVIRSSVHGCERHDFGLLARLFAVLANRLPIPHGHNQVSIGPMHHARVPTMILLQHGWMHA